MCKRLSVRKLLSGRADRFGFFISKILAAALLLSGALLVSSESTRAQDEKPQIQGEWRMELRTIESPGIVSDQEEITLIVSDRTPQGTYVVLAHVSIHAIMDEAALLPRPECKGKTECTYSDGSERVGRLIGNKFYIDWLDEGWIDDVFTISGNKMLGDDGNGPLNLTRID